MPHPPFHHIASIEMSHGFMPLSLLFCLLIIGFGCQNGPLSDNDNLVYCALLSKESLVLKESVFFPIEKINDYLLDDQERYIVCIPVKKDDSMDDKETVGYVPNSSGNLDKISKYAKITEIVDNDITTLFVHSEDYMECDSHNFNNANALAKYLQKKKTTRVNVMVEYFTKEDESLSSLNCTLEKHNIHIENHIIPCKDKTYQYCGINENHLFIIMDDGKFYCNNLEYNDLESLSSYIKTNLGKIMSISIYCLGMKGQDTPIFSYLSENKILIKEAFMPPLNSSREPYKIGARVPYSILKIQRIDHKSL
jgi:hypothetical protein